MRGSDASPVSELVREFLLRSGPVVGFCEYLFVVGESKRFKVVRVMS